MANPWRSGLHRRGFISHVDDSIRLVAPLNRFGLFQGNISADDSDNDYLQKPRRFRTKVMVAGLIMLVVVAALAGLLIGWADSSRRFVEPPDPEVPPLPSPSRLHVFQRAAVCTDSPVCSKIGNSILQNNGSAIDAAVSAQFCNGLLNQQSMGIGGGFFMTVYIKSEEKAYAVNAREKAPMKAFKDMYGSNTALANKGGMAVAVPGEVRGLWEAHKRWGKLPWASLIEPTIKLCHEGYQMSKPLYDGLLIAPYIQNDPYLRKQYFNSAKNAFNRPGSLVKPAEALCSTLERIATMGGDDLYNGTLAVDLLDDLESAGSIITAEDLRTYEPKITEALSARIGDETIYTLPPPSSGIVLINILNILQGYNLTKDSVAGDNETIATYHRIIEAFKYSYALRTQLGDPDFVKIDQLLSTVLQPENGEKVRARIEESSKTSNDSGWYGAKQYFPPDAGTAHISIIAPSGDAVSVTSSINFYFGAGFSGIKTGIIMNNVMDDFANPGFTNYFGLEPSPANFIEPGKRPMSTMSPSIIVDRGSNAKMVIGASGGTKIASAIALVIMRKLWFDQSIKYAVDSPRIHHQIFPMQIEYEYGVTKNILDGLARKGHALQRYKGRGSIVCALYRNSTGIYANSDYRKDGDVAGL